VFDKEENSRWGGEGGELRTNRLLIAPRAGGGTAAGGGERYEERRKPEGGERIPKGTLPMNAEQKKRVD